MESKSGTRQAWLVLGCSLAAVAVIALLVVLETPTGPRASQSTPAAADPTTGPGESEPASPSPSAGEALLPRFMKVLAGLDASTAWKCTVSSTLDLDSVGPDVLCLEMRLAIGGSFTGSPDDRFDAATAAAVTAFQAANGLGVDGVAGPVTSKALGVWATPQPDPSTCEVSGRSAVVDRRFQRAWLCQDGEIVRVIPVTSSSAQPDPGSYRVREKQMNATSEFSGDFTKMTHFVVFATGKFSGARVGFHSVPTHDDGSLVQPLDSVGDLRLIGESSGCIRAVPDDATAIWDFLAIDDPVIVVS